LIVFDRNLKINAFEKVNGNEQIINILYIIGQKALLLVSNIVMNQEHLTSLVLF